MRAPEEPTMSDAAALDTSYGALLRLTEGHGTGVIYEHIRDLTARLASAHELLSQTCGPQALQELYAERDTLRERIASAEGESEEGARLFVLKVNELIELKKERDTLKAELEAKNKFVTDAVAACSDMGKLREEIATLKAAVEQAHAALVKYGRHVNACMGEERCSCGLAALTSAAGWAT